MVRVMRPLPGGKGTSRRTLTAADIGVRGDRPYLTLVRSDQSPSPPPCRTMWHDDPIADPVRFTAPEDWPSDEEFEPLIAGAVDAGDLILAAQLEADRSLCAAARARLVRPLASSRDSTA